ncbi:MAG: biotin carboxylase N-terminal domain-containing protein [Janthinobacterium lividum]
MAIRKIPVANRGEIAVCIIRAAKTLGIATVHAVLLQAPDVIAAEVHTRWLEAWLETHPIAMEDAHP